MKTKTDRSIAFLAAAIANVFALLFMNTEPIWGRWTHGVVLDRWADVLFAANVAIGLQIMGYAVLTLFHPHALIALFRLVFAIANLASTIVFFNVFPLDFTQVLGPWMNGLVRVAIVIGMGGIGIAILVGFVQLLASIFRLPRHAPSHHSW